jgi:hypothetical protein
MPTRKEPERYEVIRYGRYSRALGGYTILNQARKKPDMRHLPIPKDYPVRPVRLERKGTAECYTCGLKWDDDKVTEMTPVPSGRCPFESFHVYDDDAVEG